MSEKLRKAIERLDNFIAWASGPRKEFDRGIIDSLITMTSKDPGLFSDRSLKILHELDTYWNNHSTQNKLELAKRLRKSLELSLEDSEIISEIDDITLLPYFDATGEDKSRLLDLCSDVRKIINASAGIESDHKIRLLKRLSAMEAEIYREKGRIYVVMGVAEEISESLGRIGQNVRPVIARLEEISDIVRRLTSGWLGLPYEPRKQLPPPNDEQDGEE